MEFLNGPTDGRANTEHCCCPGTLVQILLNKRNQFSRRAAGPKPRSIVALGNENIKMACRVFQRQPPCSSRLRLVLQAPRDLRGGSS
jgi:hypothetical protein